MRVKLDGSWLRVRGKRVFEGIPPELGDAARTLRERVSQLKQEISDISTEIAPVSASAPTMVKHIGEFGSGYAAQGGCTDGTYLYFYARANTETKDGIMLKLSLSDFSVVQTATMGLYHGNDLTYNPDTGLIYAATMYREGNASRVDIIDPVTLSKTDSIFAPMYISAIAYEPTREVFVGASGGTLSKYLLRLNAAGNFEHIRTVSTNRSPAMSGGSLTSQGIACDSGFIYHTWSNGKSVQIEVYNWLGQYMGAISKDLSNTSTQVEAEFIDKLGRNEFIMGSFVYGSGSGAHLYTFSAA